MRKISITRDIEDTIEKEYAQAIKASSFSQSIQDDLVDLKNDFLAARILEIDMGSRRRPNWINSPYTPQDYADYIDAILAGYDSGELLTWKPTEFCAAVSNMDREVRHEIVGKPMKLDGVLVGSFAGQLVKAMHFDDVRREIVPSIYKKLELKTCVYCNANYIITDKDGNGYFDLDHWKPKSFYPFLCISFFNLQPSCASCNRRKSASDELFFGLWDDTGAPSLDVLRFHLEEWSLTNYLVFLEREKLKVNLVEADPGNPEHQGIRRIANEKLHIDARYAEHNDYIEEIVWRSKIYNPSMIQSLRDSEFGDLIPTPMDLMRFVLGTYSNPDEVHKRPLTRLAIDLAGELGLL